jgi:BASS family bile acid:Na+ symporter
MSHVAERTIVILQLTCVMAAMGAKLRPLDFAAVFSRPKSLSWGILCQFVVSPLLAFAAVKVGITDPNMALGLILVSAMPGGPMSTLFTHLGRGNAALAVSLTGVTTILSVVTLPITLPLLAGVSAKGFEVPAGVILQETILFLFLPLGVGALIGRFRPDAAPFVARWGVRIGTTLLICYVIASLGSGRIRPGAFGWTPAITIIVFCLICMQVAMLPFRLFGWPPRDRLAVGIEMTVRDVNLALLLKTRLETTIPDDGRGDPMLYGILFFAGTALVVAAAASMIFRFLLDPHRKSGSIQEPAPVPGMPTSRSNQ